MWGTLSINVSDIVGAVRKIGEDIESQMDAAVGINSGDAVLSSNTSATKQDIIGQVQPSVDTSVRVASAAAVIEPDAKDSDSTVFGPLSVDLKEQVVDLWPISPSAADPEPAPSDCLSSPDLKKPEKSRKKKPAGSAKALKKKAEEPASPAAVPAPTTPAGDAALLPYAFAPSAPALESSAGGELMTSSSKPDVVTNLASVEEAVSRDADEPVASLGEETTLSAPVAVDAAGESDHQLVVMQTNARSVLETPEVHNCINKGSVCNDTAEDMLLITEPVLKEPSAVVCPEEKGSSAIAIDPTLAITTATATESFTTEGDRSLTSEVQQLLNENMDLRHRISLHEERESVLESRVGYLNNEVTSLSQNISKLTEEHEARLQECSRLSESLHSRERALETAMTQLAEVNAQCSAYSAKIDTLTEENVTLSAKIKSAAASNTTEAELRRQLSDLREESREKDRRLQSYDLEGQALARKQGDMEKLVRKSKTELKERDAEIVKLKEGREQLVKTIEEMQDIIRRHDSDSTNTSKSISAMQAVSQASMERLSKLEAEISVKAEEVLNQKRALDAAWAEVAEMKRLSAELRAERDDIKKLKEEKDTKIIEQDLLIKDLEQREAVLRATNKQLQESLQRQMTDASGREDRLREEIQDARKRWQDAISNRESLAAEVGQSTAPLLRQISTLQESLKSKSEAWQNIESALLERALRAENSAESSVYKMKALEERCSDFLKNVEELSARLHEREASLQELQINSDRWTRQERDYSERIMDLETRLSAESTQRLNAQSAMRELESRMRNEAREAKENVEALNKQHQLKLSMLNSEIDHLREQLENLKIPSPEIEKRKTKNSEMAAVESGSTSNSGFSRNSVSFSSSNFLTNGEVSYATANRINQQLEIKEQENQALNFQLQQLQLSRTALLQEVSFLSARNHELEERMGHVEKSTEEISRYEHQNNILLNLLGEKEEELENLMADIKEVKYLYKSQLEELFARIAPEQASEKSQKT